MITLHARATRWIHDFVQVEVTDSDGHLHRFTEKAAAIDTSERLHAQASYPVPVQIPCRPVRQTTRYRDPESLNEVDPVSRTAGSAEALRVRREQLSWTAPAVYSDLSVAGRQAAALVTFRRWRATAGVSSPELEANVEDHLWQFLTLTPSTFNAWHDSRTIDHGLGGQLEPETMRDIVAASGVREDHLEEALAALVSITYAGLFGGIESQSSLDELETVGRFTARHGVPLAPAHLFVDDLWIDSDWGRPDEALVARWRGLA